MRVLLSLLEATLRSTSLSFLNLYLLVLSSFFENKIALYYQSSSNIFPSDLSLVDIRQASIKSSILKTFLTVDEQISSKLLTTSALAALISSSSTSFSQLFNQNPRIDLLAQQRLPISIPPRSSPDCRPQHTNFDSRAKLLNVLPAKFPPTQSQKIVFPSSSFNFAEGGSSIKITQLTPSFFNRSALLVVRLSPYMFNEGYFLRNEEIIILPICPAAALNRTFFGFSFQTIWHIPTQEIGLTKAILIFCKSASSGQTMTSLKVLLIQVA